MSYLLEGPRHCKDCFFLLSLLTNMVSHGHEVRQTPDTCLGIGSSCPSGPSVVEKTRVSRKAEESHRSGTPTCRTKKVRQAQTDLVPETKLPFRRVSFLNKKKGLLQDIIGFETIGICRSVSFFVQKGPSMNLRWFLPFHSTIFVLGVKSPIH